MRHSTGLALAALGMLAVTPVRALAQTPWLGSSPGAGLTLEVIRPEFPEANFDFGSLATYLSYRHTVGERTLLVVELPFARAGFDGFAPSTGASTVFGNPYLGVRARGLTTPFTLDVGMRLPFASEDDEAEPAEMLGLLGDVDRMEAFAPRYLSFDAIAGATVQPTASPTRLRFHLGPKMVVYTGSRFSDVPAEIFAVYGAQVWLDAKPLELGAGVTGRALVTDSDLDFGERTMHQLGLTANLDLKGLRPGLQFRVPLDEDLEGLDYVLGLHLTVPMRR